MPSASTGRYWLCSFLPVVPLQSLQRIIKPLVHNSVSFLQQHIREDLAQLTKILGKSVDETITIFHLVLSSLLKNTHQYPGQCKDNYLLYHICKLYQYFKGSSYLASLLIDHFQLAVAELIRKIQKLEACF